MLILFQFCVEKSSNLKTMDFLMVSIGILLSTVVRRLLDFSSENAKWINSNFGFGLIFFYEVKYHVRTVPGTLARPRKIILQAPVAPKTVENHQNLDDFHGFP